MFGVLGDTVKRVDPISFYHLKSQVAKKLFWCIQQTKKKKEFEEELQILLAIVHDKTWQLQA